MVKLKINSYQIVGHVSADSDCFWVTFNENSHGKTQQEQRNLQIEFKVQVLFNISFNDFNCITECHQTFFRWLWTIKLGCSSNLINNIYTRVRCLSNNETSFSINGQEICEWNNKLLIWVQVKMNFWWTVMVANVVLESNF